MEVEVVVWLLMAGAAVGAGGLWFSWKRRRDNQQNQK